MGNMKTKTKPEEETPLLKFTVTIGGRAYEEDLEDAVAFEANPAGITRALVENPARYAHWATLEVLSKTEREQAEAALEILDAQLYDKFSTGAKDEKVTEIRAKVKASPERQAAADRVSRATLNHRLMRTGVETLKTKVDSVFEAARTLRAMLAHEGAPTRVSGPAQATARASAQAADDSLTDFFGSQS